MQLSLLLLLGLVGFSHAIPFNCKEATEAARHMFCQLPGIMGDNPECCASYVTTPTETAEPLSTTRSTTQPTTTRPAPRFTPRPPILKRSCYKDRDCGYKKYCHRTYGQCKNCQKERQLCRRKGMCCKGMECRYGVCIMPIKTGRLGGICKKDIDCDGDTCCAKTWGRNVCKLRLARNHMCHPPEGGLLWSLHSHCQCQEGLICAQKMEYMTMRLWGFVIYMPWEQPVHRCRLLEDLEFPPTNSTQTE